MTTRAQPQDTPFANSQATQLSPDAPEFVAPPGRSRSHSLLKAKDSASSMADAEVADAVKAAAADAAAPASDSSASRETGARGRSQDLETLDTDSGGASGGEGSSASAAKPGKGRPDGGTGRPPSSRRSGSLPNAGRRHAPASPQHPAFPDAAAYGRPVPLPIGSPAGYGYPTQGFGGPPQMWNVPMPGGRQLVFPQGSPVVVHPGGWQQQHYVMPLDPYAQGYAAQLGLAPHQLPGGYYLPTGPYGEPYDPHMAGVDWRQTGMPDGYHPAMPGGHSSLNAAAPRFTPEEGGYAGAPRRGELGSQQHRASEGEAAVHTRQASLTGSDRPRRHRRSPSVPAALPSAAAAEPLAAAPQPAAEAREAAAAPGTLPSDQAEPAGRRRGHRRQASLPTVSDMERLREGGGHRRGRHSRSDSWFGGRSSAVLEEFKASREGEGRKWTLADVKGHVVEFCKDQAGSRFIQQALEDPETTPEQIEEVAAEARPRFSGLMEDVFGNYVIQKLLERAGPADRAWMAERLRGGGGGSSGGGGGGAPRAVSLSRHQYGCRVVQKALEALPLEDKVAIMEQLLGSVLDLVADQNGNHVIQKCVECIKPTQHIEPLINELLSGADSRSIPPLRGAVVPLSQHMYGCRVVQRLLEHCSEPAVKARFMGAILGEVLPLSRNIYSNYVIQHVLEYGAPEERDAVLADLAGHMLELARDKYASNVVERCLKHGSAAARRAIVGEFLAADAAFVGVMRDDYGNYVAFSAFEFAEPEQRAALAELIRRNVPAVRRSSFGKNLHSKLAEKYPDVFHDLAVHGGRGALGARGPGPRGARPQPARQQAAQPPARQQAAPPAQHYKPAAPPAPAPAPVPAPAPLILLTPRRGGQARPRPPSKAEEPGKAAAAAGQVSVMADGANPPLFPLPPTGPPAGQEEAGQEAPQPLLA